MKEALKLLPATAQKPATIQLQLKGNTGDLLGYQQALIDAMIECDNKESRQALGLLLKALLPDEFQIKQNEPAK